jgi:hypothetical protein
MGSMGVTSEALTDTESKGTDNNRHCVIRIRKEKETSEDPLCKEVWMDVQP